MGPILPDPISPGPACSRPPEIVTAVHGYLATVFRKIAAPSVRQVGISKSREFNKTIGLPSQAALHDRFEAAFAGLNCAVSKSACG